MPAYWHPPGSYNLNVELTGAARRYRAVVQRLKGASLSAGLGCELRKHRLICVYILQIIHIMRTNIVIDDKLMNETLRLTGLKTKREAVELGLQTLLRLRQQEEIRGFRGKLDWQGDLKQMRSDK